MAAAAKDTNRTDWNEDNKRYFVHAMMNEASKGNFVDNGFKKQSWQAIQAEFRESSGCNYDKSQLHSHYAILQKKYHVYKALKDNSGFGVEPTTGAPTAPTEVWTSYIQAHPDAAPFRYQPLLFFDVLDSIFSGKVASGKYAMSSYVTPSPAATQSAKRPRNDFVDETLLSPKARKTDDDDGDDSSIDSARVNRALNRDAAPGDEKKEGGVKPVQPVPIRVARAKPGSDLTIMLGKIVAK